MSILVLPSDMVEKSTNPCKLIFGLFFLSFDCPTWLLRLLTLHLHLLPSSSRRPRSWHGTPSLNNGSQTVEHGSGDRREHSTSLAVHRRFVFPAAIAGVRWR